MMPCIRMDVSNTVHAALEAALKLLFSFIQNSCSLLKNTARLQKADKWRAAMPNQHKPAEWKKQRGTKFSKQKTNAAAVIPEVPRERQLSAQSAETRWA